MKIPVFMPLLAAAALFFSGCTPAAPANWWEGTWAVDKARTREANPFDDGLFQILFDSLFADNYILTLTRDGWTAQRHEVTDKFSYTVTLRNDVELPPSVTVQLLPDLSYTLYHDNGQLRFATPGNLPLVVYLNRQP